MIGKLRRMDYMGHLFNTLKQPLCSAAKQKAVGISKDSYRKQNISV